MADLDLARLRRLAKAKGLRVKRIDSADYFALVDRSGAWTARGTLAFIAQVLEPVPSPDRRPRVKRRKAKTSS